MRRLMDAKALTGVQLSADTGLTTTSISRILNGQSRPRRVTLTRLMERLCENKEEERALLQAYSGLVEGLPEEAFLEEEHNAQEERARAERYLEMKAQTIAFKRSVARELNKAGIPYKKDYNEGIYVTDFLVEQGTKRLAVECHFNIHRDFDMSLTIAEILIRALRCELSLIVIPYSLDMEDVRAENQRIEIIPLQELDLWLNANDPQTTLTIERERIKP